MRFVTLFSFPLLLAISARAQRGTVQVPMQFMSEWHSLSVTPGEQLIVTTRMGEVAAADSLNGFWRNISPERTRSVLSSPLVERSTFFNKDTGFLSGTIGRERKYDLIYHTTDGGRHWKKIDFGLSGRVDVVCNLDHGEAWMITGNEGIAYTRDYGFTWQTLSLPDTGRQWFSSLYINTKGQGLIGSAKNMLAYTNDKCRHWERLPTPLDQRKYQQFAPTSAAGIDHAAIYKDYFLVSQEQQVFCTRRDSINWTLLPGYTRFITDAANSAFFLITADGQYVKVNDRLIPIFVHPAETRQHIFSFPGEFCRNGSLFIRNGSNIKQLTPGNHVKQTGLFTDRPEDSEPQFLGFSQSSFLVYAATGNRIYTRTFDSTQWRYAFTLPFPVEPSGKLAYQGGDTLLYQNTRDSVFYFNLRTRASTNAWFPAMIGNFGKNGVAAILFNKGSKSCYHNTTDWAVYKREGNEFVLNEKKIKNAAGLLRTSTHVNELENSPQRISAADVEAFVRQVRRHYNKQAVIGDLAFTEEEYRRCRTDILAFRENPPADPTYFNSRSFYFHKNVIDFDRLLAAVDLVKTIDSATLNEALLHLIKFTSTASFHVAIQLVDNDGAALNIGHSNFDSNAMYFPWAISIHGATSTSLSADITRFARTACPPLLTDNNKLPILYELVRKMYSQQESAAALGHKQQAFNMK